MMIEVLESMVDESGERPRDGGEDEASSSAEREVREGIKEQEDIKRSVRATWEVGEEGHELNMHAQPLGFVLFNFSFFFCPFHLGLRHLILQETKREHKRKHN